MAETSTSLTCYRIGTVRYTKNLVGQGKCSRMSIVIVVLTIENGRERDHEKFPGWVSKEKQCHKYQRTQGQASQQGRLGKPWDPPHPSSVFLVAVLT